MSQRKQQTHQAPLYDMGAICNLTGLTPHVLRSWEARYAVVTPLRRKNGRRAYSADDLKKLRNLKILTDHGHRIGTLAKLSNNQLEKRLKEIESIDDESTAHKGPILGVTLLGEALKARSQNWTLDPPNYIEARYTSLDEALADPARPVNEVIVVELPTMHEATLNEVETILKELNGQHAIISYRFGPEQHLSNIAHENITLCPGIISQERLKSELARLKTTVRVHAVRQEPVYARRYTDAQLARISSLPPAIACECPRHVSLLLSELIHFEDYSSECESLKPGDRELHRFLNEITARARNLMEQAMAKVIEHEQFSV